MRDFFPSLDLDRIRDFPADFGDFNFESLCVRYDFTRDEHTAALRMLGSEEELSEPLKTATHETTHLLHSTTTPFGLFLYRARGLQTLLVAEAIRAASSRGQTVRFPLQNTFRSLPPAVAGEVEWRIRVLYGVELVVLAMMGETDIFSTHVLKNPFLRGATVAGLFAQIEYYLAQVRSWAQVPAQPDTQPQAASSFQTEDVDPENVGVEGPLFAFDILSGGASTLAIIESAGTISEYAGSKRLSLPDFKTKIQGTKWVHTTVPKSWLQDGLHHVQAKTLPEFIMSYLALCEIALFAPVLPEHRALRTGGVRSSEILPFLRWQNALHESTNISPMSSFRDYDRYTREVCAAAKLTPPQDIVMETVRANRDPPADGRERAYLNSQYIRVKAPGAFLDTLSILGRLPMEMDFPVIQYTDRALFLKDKLLLNQLVMGYLMRAAVRRMLLRPDLTVTMPYPPTPEEVNVYTAELRASLEQGLGMPLPGVSVAKAD